MRGGYRRIPEEKKNIILKQVKEDLRDVSEVAREFEVNPKTIYNWLKKEVDETGRSDTSYLREIHKLQREKEDLIQIVWAMTVVVERMKKKDTQNSFSSKSIWRKKLY